MMATSTYRAGILRHIGHATTKANSEYNMVYNNFPWIRVFALDFYCPLIRFRILRSVRDLRGCPDIQFQAVGIILEPIRNLSHVASAYTI